MMKNKPKKRESAPAKNRVFLPPSVVTPGESVPVAVRQYAVPAEVRQAWEENRAESAERTKLRVAPGAEKEKVQGSLRKSLRRMTVIFLLLLLLVLLAAAILVISSLFVVKEIRISGTERFTAAELAEAGGITEGARLVSLSRREAETRIRERFPELSSCEVKVGPDGNVEILVEERLPVMYFDLAGKYYAITEDLFVTESAEDPAAFAAEGLLPAELSGIAVAVEGRKLEFLSGTGEYITAFLQAAKAEGALDPGQTLSFGNRYSIVSYGENGSTTLFGSVENIRRKLKIAEQLRAGGDGLSRVLRIDVSEPDAVLVEEVN